MTKNLDDLINKLSSEIKPVKSMPNPIFWVMGLFLVLGFYAIILQMVSGLRSDLVLQLGRFSFTAELILVFLLLLSSLVAAVLVMYPDSYQKSPLLKLPVGFFVLTLVFLTAQLFMMPNVLMVIPEVISHKMECTICIGTIALIPSALLFVALRQGATTHPLQAGLFVVLAASSLGYLFLRLYEPVDSVAHVLIWHYLPMIVFALFGVLLGKAILKW